MIDVGKISSMNFNLTATDKHFLFEQGKTAVTTYFTTLNPTVSNGS